MPPPEAVDLRFICPNAIRKALRSSSCRDDSISSNAAQKPGTNIQTSAGLPRAKAVGEVGVWILDIVIACVRRQRASAKQ